MRREDWFWVAVKVIGLWFAVDGVVDLAAAMTASGSMPGGLGRTLVVPAVVTLVAGVLLLFAGQLLVPPGAGASEAAGAPSGRIDAIGLFWAASKVIGLLTVLGALIVCVTVLVLPGFDQPSGGSWKGRVFLAAVPVAAVGLWLLLGEAVFRAASRNS